MRMKREEIAKSLSRKTGLTKSEARDEVDKLVNKILDKLRQGQPVHMPGVGKLKNPSKNPG
jgi:nucleoid DNA-binding protein